MNSEKRQPWPNHPDSLPRNSPERGGETERTPEKNRHGAVESRASNPLRHPETIWGRIMAIATETRNAQAGKYLTFRLAGEEYGIEILKVVEIIKIMEITSLPRMPEAVRGVINLRGKVIPVVELRRQFGMETTTDTSETCIIVVNVRILQKDVQMGILVDTVSEVLDILEKDIEPPPQFGSQCNTNFILGMAKAKGDVKLLLDINRVLSGDEIQALAEDRSTVEVREE